MSSRILDLLDDRGALEGPLFESLRRRLEPVPPDPGAGARIGPYRLVRALGRGGMASVHLAERVDGEFEQLVALKLVGGDGAALERREILKRERQILARLQHPRIAALLDGGTTAEGAIWFALELVDGTRIDHWCRERALTPRARVRLLLDACEAVAFAHTRLLVHRDLKPSNLLVSGTGEVKLLDFGIAGVLAAGGTASEAPRALSPGWASPEQLASGPVGTASDIWQLGRLLAVLVADDADPGAELGAIIVRATREEPGERYATVAEFAADLLSWLDHRPVRAYGQGSAYRLGRFLRRHRIASAISGIAAAAFITLALHFTWRLAQERDNALSAAARAEATTAFLVGLFEGALPNLGAGESLTAAEVLALGERRLLGDGERALDDQPGLRAHLLGTVADVYLSMRRFAEAERLLDAALRQNAAFSDDDRTALAARWRNLARAQWRLDRFDAALGSARRAAALIPTGPAHAEQRALLLNTQAAIATRLARYEEALALEQQVLAMPAQELAPAARARAFANLNRAAALRGLGRDDEALRAGAEALAIAHATLGREHTDSFAIAAAHAQDLVRSGRVGEGLVLAEGAFAGAQRLLAPSGTPAAERAAWAETLRLAGRHAEAAAEATRALAEVRASPGAESLAASVVQLTLGRALIALGRAGDAEPVLDGALALRLERLPAEHPEIAEAEAALGIARCQSGAAADGRALITGALARRAGPGPASGLDAEARAALARCVAPAPD